MASGDSDDEYDTPSPSSISSIFLILIASLSFLLSFSVIFIFRLLTPSFSTSSSKLVLLLHISISIGTIFKFPYLNSSHLLCQVSGFVVNYVGCQIIIVTYYLFRVTNIFDIVSNNENTRSDDYKLPRYIVAMVLIVPIVTGLVSIVFTEYHELGPWCQIDRSHDSSPYVRISIYVFLWILQLVTFANFFYLIYLLWKLPSTIIFATLSRILSGPISFALYTCIIYISIDLVVLYSALYSHGLQGQYYIDYAYTILQYMLGLGYAIIYYTIERKNLQALESHFQELNLFERVFFVSMSEMSSPFGSRGLSKLSEMSPNDFQTNNPIIRDPSETSLSQA